MIGWTAEHMELTDGDGRTNRLRYRWNRVRWANPNGHLAKAEPGNASPRAAGSAALCPVTCAVSVGKSARILNERRAGIRYALSQRRGRAPWQASPPRPAGANGRGLPTAYGPRLLGAAGAGLIGSGMFVTDPVGGFPPAEDGSSQGTDAAASPSLQGSLHNLCAIPVFAGIPVAGLASALAAARRQDYGWACYSAVSSLSMAGSFTLFGAAFGERVPRLLRKGGLHVRGMSVFGLWSILR